MKYSPEDIRQGNNLQRQAQETPSNFGILDGATERPTGDSVGKSRMAGPAGSRALAMMNDPDEQQRTQNWMANFGMSNEGMEFNQARMMMENPQPPEEQQ